MLAARMIGGGRIPPVPLKTRMPPNESRLEDPLRGIALHSGATVLFAVADTTSKYLSSSLPVIEIQWIRYVLFFGFAVLLARNVPRRTLRPRNPKIQLLRGAAVTASSVLFVFGVRQMSVAEATTISFLSPLLITILSIPLLGEFVGIRRWGAVLAGMLGVLIVVRPGTSGFQPAALWGVASSFCWATALIITRKIATTDQAATTLLCSAGIGALVLTALVPLAWTWPTAGQWGLVLMLGVLSSGGQWMVILAHRQAAASLLAPFSYSQLIWASAAGFLVFGALPDRWTVLGAGVIIASGLYTAHRERVRAREWLG
jgi:drug/metabolite transporter (DMT)-like permease